MRRGLVNTIVVYKIDRLSRSLADFVKLVELFDQYKVTFVSVKSENINPSFVSRILRLAYLSPTLVEAILDGKHPAHLTMKRLIAPFPMEWGRQREHFFGRSSV